MDRKRDKDSRRNKIHVAKKLHETLKDCYVAGKSVEYTHAIKAYNNVVRELRLVA